MKANRPLSSRERLIYGTIFGGVGLFVMWLSVTDAGSVNGPWRLGFAAGGIFGAAGLSIATQGTPVGRWVGPVAVATIFLGFAVLGNWIAFGPGVRACSGGVSFLFFWTSRSVGDLECRVAFGIGAVIVNGALVMGALVGLGKLLGGEVWPERLKRAGESVFMVTLLPVLLPLLLFTIVTGFGREARDRVVARFRGGGGGEPG